jgi:hypothetical protein
MVSVRITFEPLEVQVINDYRRIWVIQEIALPSRSTFFCGRFAIDASTVLKATVWLQYKSAFIASHLHVCQGRHNTNDIAYIRFLSGSLESKNTDASFLRYLLAISTRFESSDPRDKIFALVDFLQSSNPAFKHLFGLLRPDYGKAVEKVFRDATTFAVLALNSLHIFRNIYHRGNDVLELEGYASWVPQWQRTFDFRKDAYRLPEVFDTALGTEVSSPVMSGDIQDSGPEVLPVRGFVVTRVDQTTEVIVEKTPRDELYRSVEDIVGNQQKAERRFSGDSLVELLANDDLCQNRRFFGATCGFIGVGPSVLRKGDFVTIVYGAPWPIILRRVGNGYQFLGQCAVPGIMQGEAVREHKAKNLPDEMFMLH